MKIARQVKSQITKLFKSGKTVDAIMLAVADDFPRITASRVNEVVRQHLFEQADELWSIAVKIGGRCEISGKTYNLEAHHLIKRDNLAYRWDLMNGVCLNSFHHKDAHVDEETFFLWLKECKPVRWGWYGIYKDFGGLIQQVNNDYLLQTCKDIKHFIERRRHENSDYQEIGKRKRVITETDAV